MTLVTVTYRAWDHNRKVVSVGEQPRVYFRPLSTDLTLGLMTDREIFGTLDPVTGVGSVQLESAEGLLYQPVMDWLIDDNSSAPTNRARESCEWTPFFPSTGGDISSLDPAVGLRGVLTGFGLPPGHLDRAVYLDLTGPRIRIYGPAGGRI